MLRGENPVEFVEEFLENYSKGGWVTWERDRLTQSINAAIDGAAGNEP